MSVSEIKDYLQQRGQAPLADIANHFSSEPEAVSALLEHWQRKGRISQVSVPKCNGCNRCGNSATVLFRWIA